MCSRAATVASLWGRGMGHPQNSLSAQCWLLLPYMLQDHFNNLSIPESFHANPQQFPAMLCMTLHPTQITQPCPQGHVPSLQSFCSHCSGSLLICTHANTKRLTPRGAPRLPGHTFPGRGCALGWSRSHAAPRCNHYPQCNTARVLWVPHFYEV